MRILIALAVTLKLSVYPVCIAEEPASQLRVLCFNIHYGQGMDGQYDLERLAQVINAAKPDLVALQEVDVMVRRSGKVHQVQKLGELTKFTARFGPTQHYEGGLYGNAILTRLPIVDELIVSLPYTEATPELQTYPRGAIMITVTAPDGKPLRFISTHFQHNVPADREQEAQAINALFALDDAPRTILAGDFNATPEAKPIAILSSRWTATIDAAWTPSSPSIHPKSRIDYIFYRPESAFQLMHSEVIPDAMASDHRPVLVVLELANR